MKVRVYGAGVGVLLFAAAPVSSMSLRDEVLPGGPFLDPAKINCTGIFEVPEGALVIPDYSHEDYPERTCWIELEDPDAAFSVNGTPYDSEGKPIPGAE